MTTLPVQDHGSRNGYIGLARIEFPSNAGRWSISKSWKVCCSLAALGDRAASLTMACTLALRIITVIACYNRIPGSTTFADHDFSVHDFPRFGDEIAVIWARTSAGYSEFIDSNG